MPMPKTGGRRTERITFIVGDPRSRQNISKIRSHASKVPKSRTRASTLPESSKRNRPSSAPTPPAATIASDPRSSGEISDISELGQLATPLTHDSPSGIQQTVSECSERVFSRDEFQEGEVPPQKQVRQDADVNLAPSQSYTDNVLSEINEHVLRLPGLSVLNDHPSFGFKHLCLPSPISQQQDLFSLPLRSSRRSSSFTTVGTALGTWFENHPTMQAAATFDNDFDPHKRAKLLRPDAKQGNVRDIPDVYVNIATVGDSHLKERTSEALQTHWSFTTRPSRSLTLSRADATFEQILLRTNAYHISLFETKWLQMLKQNPQSLDSDGRLASLYESNLTIAALIEAGRPAFANIIIERNLLVMRNLLRSEHPRLFSVLSVMALDGTTSVLGQFHQKFVEAIIPLAEDVLGDKHPCTLLLKCILPPGTKARLREAVQRRIHEQLLATFGDAHQTYEGVFILGRILAQSGQIEEALGVLAWLKPRWEGAHGLNSMLAVYILLDEATIYLRAGQAGVKTEMIISDALRRLKILDSDGRYLPEDERQKRSMGFKHMQVAALRTLGKMHVMRRNYGAAIECYRQAVDLAKGIFGNDAPQTQLAQGDLDRATASGIGHWTLVYTPSEQAEEEIEIVDTVLGKIARSKVAFGQEAVKVPFEQGQIYGLMPYEDLRWREGVAVG